MAAVYLTFCCEEDHFLLTDNVNIQINDGLFNLADLKEICVRG